MGPGLELKQGLKLMRALWWGYWIGRLICRGRRETGKATLGPATTPTPFHLRHHLIYYQAGETENEGLHMSKKETDREREHKAPNSAFSLVATTP